MAPTNKKQRALVLEKTTPETWHAYCVMESKYETREITLSKAKLASELGLAPNTLNRYLTAWSALGLVYAIPGGGFIIEQLDGAESALTAPAASAAPNEKLKTAKDVYTHWCSRYREKYGVDYVAGNYAMAMGQCKKLLQTYGEDQLLGVIDVVTRLYDTKWLTPQYPRPTLGQLVSWLAQQALPYAEKRTAPQTRPAQEPHDDTLMDDLLQKGWI